MLTLSRHCFWGIISQVNENVKFLLHLFRKKLFCLISLIQPLVKTFYIGVIGSLFDGDIFLGKALDGDFAVEGLDQAGMLHGGSYGADRRLARPGGGYAVPKLFGVGGKGIAVVFGGAVTEGAMISDPSS